MIDLWSALLLDDLPIVLRRRIHVLLREARRRDQRQLIQRIVLPSLGIAPVGQRRQLIRCVVLRSRRQVVTPVKRDIVS